jgi:hypothetical protein
VIEEVRAVKATARRLLAFADESQSHQQRDPNCYVLAAGLCDPADVDQARSAMLGLQLPGQRKVHWRDESRKRHQQIIEVVAGLPLQHLVVVRDGRAGEKPERRRRHCLERLLYELDTLHVATVTCESRGRRDDHRDRTMLDTLRARQALSSELRLDHLPGPKDPLLWIPDAVCGAITHDRVGNSSYVRMLEVGVVVQIITITAP